MNIDKTKSGLKDAWTHAFLVGAAISGSILSCEQAVRILHTHFSSVTAENAMKMAIIHPEENRWNWDEADSIANFARSSSMKLRGHTFICHKQVPDWIFKNENTEITQAELFSRVENHIATVTSRYGDIVYAWDVLNEIIDVENGIDDYRKTPWLKIGEPELFRFAFRTAHEAAPSVRLFYNDYDIETGEKMEASIRFISELLDEGIPIHGVGIQGHWNYNYPDDVTLRRAFERYTALGLDIEITELDISAYQRDEKNNRFETMPKDRLLRQAQQYRNIFLIAADYPAVKNITTWGIADNHTWLDNFPVPGRKNWPLLFDMRYQNKSIVPELLDMGFTLSD